MLMLCWVEELILVVIENDELEALGQPKLTNIAYPSPPLHLYRVRWA